MQDMKTVDRRSDLSYETFISQYAIPGKPVIIAGAMDDWRATKLWNTEFFRTQYGSKKVTISRTNSSEKLTVKLSSYIDYMLSKKEQNPWYLGNWRFGNDIPELAKDYCVPDYFFDNWMLRLPEPLWSDWKWIFMGPSGSGTSLHCDVGWSSAWNALFCGKKKWVFLPPNQSRYVYNGQVDAFNPDFDKYPLFKKATPICCTQKPGEIVFTPSVWWHQVYNEGPTIALTENYVDKTNYKTVLMHLYLSENHMLYRLLKQFVPKNAPSIS